MDRMEENRDKKKKLMLISPMLHQGGFERVCITTARLLEPYFDITIVIFDSADIAYDVEGLTIIDIQLGVRRGKLQKLLNIVRRSLKVRGLKKRMRPAIVYSFGPTANMVNAFSRTGREKVWLGLRNYTDVEETAKIKLFVRLADLIICTMWPPSEGRPTAKNPPFPGKSMTGRAGRYGLLFPWAGTTT